MWDELRLELESRELAGRKRSLRVVPNDLFDAASNDYLGLSRHPEVIKAASDAAQRFGAGARASRLVSGTFSLVQELERELARFKGTESALVFSSGFAANLGVLSALSNSQTTLFCHKRNHASLLDGCRLAQSKGARVRFWESPGKLESLLEKSEAARKIVVADGVFSMDGDLLPLPQVLELCERFDAVLVLDDAHGTGTLGATGRGLAEHFGVASERIITVGTLSKALGSQGGFVAAKQLVMDYLVGSAPSFIYSTGLNPPAVGAALQALRVLQREPERVARCRENARFVAQVLCELEFDARFSGSPIVPVVIGDEAAALAQANRLESRGVWCPAIRPPTVAKGTSRLRIAASSEWSREDLRRLLQPFAD
jgi:8-amino-7-oxononanoate synthase